MAGSVLAMKLIVGLGNPGQQYQGSRHNVGFRVIDQLARQWSVDLSRHKHQAVFGKTMRLGLPVGLLKPQTFMNRSGESVAQALAFYKILPADLLVIVDDMNLQLDQIRIRPKGSAGGHNGLQDIIDKLGRDDFNRLRLGIGSAEPDKAVDYVLGNFMEAEQKTIEQAVRRAAEAAQCWADLGIEQVMNRFNPFDRQVSDKDDHKNPSPKNDR